MEKLNELEFFEDLLNTPRNTLVEKAVKAGRVPIGYNCYAVPEPLLSVGKLFPVCLRAPEVLTTELANFYMTPYICSYSRSILEEALNGKYAFLGGLVFAASCTHIQRVGHHFTILDIDKHSQNNENFLHYIIDVPRKVFAGNVDPMVNDFRKLGDKISSCYGVEMSDKALSKAIKEYNEFNKILKEIADLRKEDNPKITGTEWHTVYTACKAAPKDLLIKPLKKLKAELDTREVIKADVPRIMVMGSVLDNPNYTQLIESQGCVVVADRYCFGSLPGLEEIKETGDPYRDLALHYLSTIECPRMMEKSRDRVENVLQWVEEYKVDGVIFETMKFCDLWGYEVLTAQRAIMNKEIPIVRIEREYQLNGEGQLRTRVQAFIESIENKKLFKEFV